LQWPYAEYSGNCEGIETKKQSDFLMSAGCLYAQGFYYSRPVSQADFEKKLDAASTSTNEWVYGINRIMRQIFLRSNRKHLPEKCSNHF
jgi:c-di-GMP-related signal transduction protein